MNRTGDHGLCPYDTRGYIPELSGNTLHWVNSLMNIPFGLTAALGNALILWTIVRTKSLHSPSNILLFGLALSDFCTGLFVQTLYVIWRVAELTESPSVSCHAWIAVCIASRFVLCTSLVTLAAVSLERYVALRLHLRYKDIITIKRVYIFLLSVWILSGLGSATSWFIDRTVASLLTVCVLMACVSISVFSCFKISVILRRHLRRIDQESARVDQALDWRRDKRLAVVTLYLNCVYFLCILPYACTVVVIKTTGRDSSKLVALHFTGTLVVINSAIDPFIFCWRLKKIRVAVLQSLATIFLCQK